MNPFRRWRAKYPASLRGARRRELSRIGSYAVTTRLFLSDAIRNLRWDIPRVIVLGLLGLGAQVGALALLLLVVRHVERGQGDAATASLGDMAVGTQQIYVFAASICVLLLLSAWLQYVSQRELFRVMARYERYVYRTLFEMYAFLPTPGASAANAFARTATMQRQLATAPRSAAMFLRRVISALVPLVQSVGALGVLLMLDWAVTLAVLGVLVFAGMGIYAVNIQGVRLSRQMEDAMPALALERRHTLARFFALPVAERAVSLDEHIAGNAFETAQQTFYGRLLAVDKSRLAAALGAAVVFALVLVSKGHTALFGDGSVTALIAYVIALQYFSSGLRNVTGMATAINRFYPQVARVAVFLRLRGDPAQDSDDNGDPGSVSLTVTDLVSGRRSKCELAAGTRVCLLTRRAGARDALVDFVERLRLAAGPPVIGMLDYRIGDISGIGGAAPTTESAPGAEHLSRTRLVVRNGACNGRQSCPSTVTEIYCATVADHDGVGFGAYARVMFVRHDGEIMACTPVWADEHRHELTSSAANASPPVRDVRDGNDELLNDDEY